MSHVRGVTTHLEQLEEALVLAAHVLDGIENIDAGREAPLDLGDRLGHGGAGLGRLEILGQEDAQVGDAVDGREQHRHDHVLALLVRLTGPQPVRQRRDVIALGRGAIEEHVDDVALLRQLVAQRPPLGPGPLAEVDADAPAKVDVVGLDAEEPTGLEERQGVRRVVDAVARVLGKGLELLAETVVLGDLRLLLDVHRRVLRRELLQFCAVSRAQRRGTHPARAWAPTRRSGIGRSNWRGQLKRARDRRTARA